MTKFVLIAAVLLAPAVQAQDSWDTIPKPGDADQFRPGEKAGPMPGTRDGKPDLSGIWQERTLANWNVVKHRGDYGVPGAPGIVEGDAIPYQDGALKKRAELAKSLYNDPQAHCQLPGVPRITYTPFAFEIVQTPGKMDALYEYAHAWRIFHLDRTTHPSDAASFDANTLWYEATLEDPKVYTRPWKLRLPLHRQAKNFEPMEYECND
jgi:hypothetical protein